MIKRIHNSSKVAAVIASCGSDGARFQIHKYVNLRGKKMNVHSRVRVYLWAYLYPYWTCVLLCGMFVTLCNTRWSSLIYPIIRKHSSSVRQYHWSAISIFYIIIQSELHYITRLHQQSFINFNILPTINVTTKKREKKNYFHFIFLFQNYLFAGVTRISGKYLSVMPSYRVRSI